MLPTSPHADATPTFKVGISVVTTGLPGLVLRAAG